MSSPFVTDLPRDKIRILRTVLEEEGFTFDQPPYTHFSAKRKGLSCTLYESGKLVVQGKEMPHFIEFVLEPQVLHTFTFRHSEPKEIPPPHIGVDESGKGDFFGPLCVAGVYADEQGIQTLEKEGIRDCKKMSDAQVLQKSGWIKKSYTHEIVRISPKKYNELYRQFGNLNHLLAWGHATVIAVLAQKTNCPLAWIDQFANPRVLENALEKKKISMSLLQKHRAEEDPVVAAASVLARAAFLEDLEKLERKYQLRFPKGASTLTIAAGKAFVRQYGEAELTHVGKEHFKTLDAILENK